MNLYKVVCLGAADSGFIIYLVMADNEDLAELEIRRKIRHTLGISITKIDIHNDKDNCLVEIINYNNPLYEG